MDSTNFQVQQPVPMAEIRHLELDNTLSSHLFRQLYLALRQQILEGQLRPGTRLPSSRALANQLELSRNTVLASYEQLLAEGYLQSKSGAGTFVSTELPESWHQAPIDKPIFQKTDTASSLSEYAARISTETIRTNGSNSSFTVGLPDLRAFPEKIWNRLSQQIPATGFTGVMGFGDPAGYAPLRDAIADYVRSSRAVHCEASQVVITAGAQQGLDLCARLLLNTGDIAAMEDPGYMGARRAFQSVGADLKACPVDNHGLIIDTLYQLPKAPTLVYVTPAHQYPMGPALSLERRTALLDWAQINDSWIIEDDYDSEYHYNHRPLASLQGLALQQQVIYSGSFSKVLFPSLRLGYLVLPPSLVAVFVKAKMEHAGETPMHTQAVTAAFMQEGHFGRHLKRMRLSYGAKLDTMLEYCKPLSSWCQIHASGAGMHLVLELKTGLSEACLHKALTDEKILCSRLSSYYISPCKKSGLVLGFANCQQTEIRDQMQAICKIMQRLFPQKDAFP